ncbi:MAG: hypothetical protein M1834_006997 [Cirrosporium novae-zelandiae]|nr:MAG: hypothetical protein M1834_006997 [Cirrosporium novae-zelandiae]
MRYQNWDVLLFPENHRAPIQEFKTACNVIQDLDTGSPQMFLDRGLPNPHGLISPSQTPLVTSFVPGLKVHSPFLVSIHNWDTPQPSKTIESLCGENDTVLWEARVFIDGTYKAGIFLKEDALWPQVLTHGIQLNKEGDPEQLLFPAFHNELLQERWWNPSENIGRIKVIISEGISNTESLPFRRVKQLAVFSWQHVPLNILENCGIAWPNSGMWLQILPPQYPMGRSTVLSGQLMISTEAHSHSPTLSPRSQHQECASALMEDIQVTSLQPAFQWPVMHPIPLQREHYAIPSWNTIPTANISPPDGPDPFLETANRGFRGSDDQSMPDCSASSFDSSRNASDFNIYYSRTPSLIPSTSSSMPLNLPDEIHEGLRKNGTSGTFAPSNPRISSTVSTPAMGTRPSAAADARSASYANHTRVSIQELLQPGSREASTTPVAAEIESNNGVGNESIPATKVHTRPTGNIKGKKEGREGDVKGGKKISSASGCVASRTNGTNESPKTAVESKRKRSATTVSGEKQRPSRKTSKLSQLRDSNEENKDPEEENLIQTTQSGMDDETLRRVLTDLNNFT